MRIAAAVFGVIILSSACGGSPIAPDSSNLSAYLPLSAATSVGVDDMWVVNGQNTRHAVPSLNASTMTWAASGGPNWLSGAVVDVIVRLHLPDGTTTLLRNTGVTIRYLT